MKPGDFGHAFSVGTRIKPGDFGNALSVGIKMKPGVNLFLCY
jgi:hypothetical protein